MHYVHIILKEKIKSRKHWYYQSHSHTHSNNRDMGCGSGSVQAMTRIVLSLLCTDGDSSALLHKLFMACVCILCL
jgi:hypothetical protein